MNRKRERLWICERCGKAVPFLFSDSRCVKHTELRFTKLYLKDQSCV